MQYSKFIEMIRPSVAIGDYDYHSWISLEDIFDTLNTDDKLLIKNNEIIRKIVNSPEVVGDLDLNIKDLVMKLGDKSIQTKYSCGGHPLGIGMIDGEFYLFLDMIGAYINLNTNANDATRMCDNVLNNKLPLFSELLLDDVSSRSNCKIFLVDLMVQDEDGFMPLTPISKELVNKDFDMDVKFEIRSAIEPNIMYPNNKYNVTVSSNINGIFTIPLRELFDESGEITLDNPYSILLHKTIARLSNILLNR